MKYWKIDMNAEIDDNLIIQRVAGGSIIEYPPLFSYDCEWDKISIHLT